MNTNIYTKTQIIHKLKTATFQIYSFEEGKPKKHLPGGYQIYQQMLQMTVSLKT